jgi:hypothetical protein
MLTDSTAAYRKTVIITVFCNKQLGNKAHLICCVENALSLGIKYGKDEGGNLALIGNGNPVS